MSLNSKLVASEEALRKKEAEVASLVRRHKEEMKNLKAANEKAVERKASEIKALQNDLTRSKLAKVATENEKAILQDKFDKNLSELESRRREATTFMMKRVQLDMATAEMEDRAANLTRRVQYFATSHVTLNAREAEINATQNFTDLVVQEKLKELRAKAEADLAASFAAVQARERNVAALEGLMREVAQRENAVAEREMQCTYLLEEKSVKTAELVLAREGSFAERVDGTLQAIIAEFVSLHRALDEKTVVPAPIGSSLDDAKKGEGKKEKKEVRRRRRRRRWPPELIKAKPSPFINPEMMTSRSCSLHQWRLPLLTKRELPVPSLPSLNLMRLWHPLWK